MLVSAIRRLDHGTAAMAAALSGRNRRVDAVFAAAAEHGAVVEVGLLVAMFLGGGGNAARARRSAAVRSALALPLAMLAVGIVGRIANRQRPFARAGETALLVEHSPTRSFPSRHAACAVAMACVATPASPVIGNTMTLVAGLMLGGRIYARLHYPSDVAAGGLLGAAIGMALRGPGNPRTMARTR